MLKQTLPIALNTNKVDRHEYEVEVVKQAQQALAAVQASLESDHKERTKAQDAMIAPAEMQTRAKVKKDAEADLEAAKNKLVSDKNSKKDAEKAVSGAEDVLKTARAEETKADKTLQGFVRKQARLTNALEKEFELVQGNSSSCPGASRQ